MMLNMETTVWTLYPEFSEGTQGHSILKEDYGQWNQGQNQHDSITIELAVFIIGVIGILGNTLVLIVLLGFHKVRNKLCNILVINQSLVDFTSCVTFIVSYTSKAIPKSFAGAGGQWMCWLLDSSLVMWDFINISALSLVGITIERYLMVVHPIFHRNALTQRRLVMYSIICWVLPIALNLPLTFPATGVMWGKCIPFIYWTQDMSRAYTLLCFSIYFLLPTFILVICYGHMLVVLHRRLQIQAHTAQHNNVAANPQVKKTNLSKRQVNLTKSMVLVSVCFVVCIGPVNCYFMAANYLDSLGFESQVNRILTYLALTNSTINPFIYAFKYEDFKMGVKRLFSRQQQVDSSGDTITHPAASSIILSAAD